MLSLWMYATTCTNVYKLHMTEYNKLSSFPKHLQVPSTIWTSEFCPLLAHKTAKKFFPIDMGRALETFESLPEISWIK